jgi:hypothetical protein
VHKHCGRHCAGGINQTSDAVACRSPFETRFAQARDRSIEGHNAVTAERNQTLCEGSSGGRVRSEESIIAQGRGQDAPNCTVALIGAVSEGSAVGSEGDE